MNKFENIICKILNIDFAEQKIGLSQFKDNPTQKHVEPSIKRKDVKLSDLMRRTV